MEKLILVDAMNLVFRSHFAHRVLSTGSKPTSVLFGFLAAYERLLAISRKVVIVWEHGFSQATVKSVPERSASWRSRLFPEYKANRKKNDETKVANDQIPELIQVLNMIGARQVGVPGVEADDLIYMCICSVPFNGGFFVYSTDRDFYQLVDDRRPVYVLRPEHGKGERLIDARAVRNETGVPPEDFAALKALMGDSTDNYKALPGIGPKRAVPMFYAGVDPRQESFALLSAKAKREYDWVAQHWSRLHVCYRLAKLESNPPMTDEARRAWDMQRSCLRASINLSSLVDVRSARREFRGWCQKNHMREFDARIEQFIQ